MLAGADGPPGDAAAYENSDVGKADTVAVEFARYNRGGGDTSGDIPAVGCSPDPAAGADGRAVVDGDRAVGDDTFGAVADVDTGDSLPPS